MITLTPEDAVELPVDELGLLVLQDIVDLDEWSEYNYLLRYTQDVRRLVGFGTNPDAVNTVAEACG